jgi:antirestriction protein
MSPRYKRDGRLPHQDVQGQAVVVAPARREVHEFDETATFLWATLARERSVEDLVDALREEYDVDAAEAEKDVREFVALLEEKGLVIRA